MPSRLAFRGRIFAPTWWMSLLALAAFVGFTSLGRWQWERGNARDTQWKQFAQGTEHAPVLGSLGLAEIPRFQRVTVMGQLDSLHQFLLDNRVHAGRAGYEVLTPLDLPDGRTLLVNRGWVPSSGHRDLLPDVSVTAAGQAQLVGRIDELPSRGLEQGRAAPELLGHWPKVTSFPTTMELSAALGRKLEPRVILLDARAPNGYVREWQPPGLSPSRHWGYAVQWWCMATAVLVLWALLSWKKERTPQ